MVRFRDTIMGKILEREMVTFKVRAYFSILYLFIFRGWIRILLRIRSMGTSNFRGRGGEE